MRAQREPQGYAGLTKRMRCCFSFLVNVMTKIINLWRFACILHAHGNRQKGLPVAALGTPDNAYEKRNCKMFFKISEEKARQRQLCKRMYMFCHVCG